VPTAIAEMLNLIIGTDLSKRVERCYEQNFMGIILLEVCHSGKLENSTDTESPQIKYLLNIPCSRLAVITNLMHNSFIL
jgi:hypothetical protein